MTDEELAMAYADGELDEMAARRFEKRLAGEHGLAEAVAAHRALRTRMAAAFAPVAEEPVSDRFVAMLTPKVVALPLRRAAPRWWVGGSVAASLAAGVLIGQLWPRASASDRNFASATLAHALEKQLASDSGDTRMLVSFREAHGQYCRVFVSARAEGLACHEDGAWVLRQLEPRAKLAAGGEYRQAASAGATVMAAAQEMMVGGPLDVGDELKARDAGWR